MTTTQKIESIISDSSTTNSSVSASPAQDGLTTGWSVEIDRTSADALTADELRGILQAVWANAADEPTFIRLTILTADGTQMVDAGAAAGELGIDYVTMREVYVFQKNALESLLGVWSAS